MLRSCTTSVLEDLLNFVLSVDFSFFMFAERLSWKLFDFFTETERILERTTSQHPIGPAERLGRRKSSRMTGTAMILTGNQHHDFHLSDCLFKQEDLRQGNITPTSVRCAENHEKGCCQKVLCSQRPSSLLVEASGPCLLRISSPLCLGVCLLSSCASDKLLSETVV